MMEERQLNFDQPLLSVRQRRFSSTVASQKNERRKIDGSLPRIPPLPSYKPELKSGPLRNTGNVPFVWEDSPGRPKDEMNPQIHAKERPPTVPRLPPGWVTKPNKQDSIIVSEDTSVAKDLRKDPFRVQNVSLPEEKAAELKRSKQTLEDSSDSGDGDDAYVDALDTLSTSESFFYNCSVSGLSGLDSDVKPSGTFSKDPKTRDFMMDRFLPAAKAMASEAPQHAPRKQSVVQEPPRKVKNVVKGNKQPALRYGPEFVQKYAYDKVEEESDDEYDRHGNVSFNVCGLLPRFCLKGSFLLNTVPGTSMRTRVPMSPVSRTQPSSASVGSCSETDNESARVAVYKQRSLVEYKAAERDGDGSVLKNEDIQIIEQNNLLMLEGSNVYKRLQGNDISTHHNESSQSTCSEQEHFLSNHGEAKNSVVNSFNSNKKGLISFKELLADDSNNKEADSAMVEKTLYVDTVHKIESPKANSCSSDMNGQSIFREEDVKILPNSKGIEGTPSFCNSVEDNKNSSIAYEETVVQSKFPIPVSLKQDTGMETEQVYGKYARAYRDYKTSVNKKVPGNMKLDYEVQQSMLVENSGSFSELPVPPPLPKSPSDSWLWRTLPSVPSKNASPLRTGLSPRNLVSKTSYTDPQWEKNGQAAKVRHQQSRFSEVILTPIQET